MSKIYGIGDEEELVEDLQKELFELKRNPNIIEIPDNATNGDMIKTMFDNEMAYNLEFYIKNYMLCTDWWNAPYKKGENK